MTGARKKARSPALANTPLKTDKLKEDSLTAVERKTALRQKQRHALTTQQQRAKKAKMASLLISDKNFVSIPAGTFIMGSTTESDERRHSVNIANFDLMDAPVTFSQYDQYCEDVVKDKPGDENWGRNDRPVIRVSYWDAVDFAKWITQKTRIAHRLPTEAEWEYACRAGTDTEFWWGDTADPSRMNYDNDIGQTIPVKELGINVRNPWKIYDMHGNVWEWCASLYDKDYGGAEQRDGSSTKSIGPRVLRGGSWAFFASRAKSASRFHTSPNYSNIYWGFRLARPK